VPIDRHGIAAVPFSTVFPMIAAKTTGPFVSPALLSLDVPYDQKHTQAGTKTIQIKSN